MPNYDDEEKSWATPPPTAPSASARRPLSAQGGACATATASAGATAAKKKRLRRQFIFDHLWGIPGGWSRQDLAILRSLHQRQQPNNNDASNSSSYVILDERDLAENRDRCCNHALGRAAREFAWHGSAHGTKFTVFSAKRTVDRVAWGALTVAAFVAGVVLSVLLVCAYHEEPVFVAVDKVRHRGGGGTLLFCSYCTTVQSVLAKIQY